MATKKISQLTSATSVGAGDVIPIVQGGVTKKVPASLLGGGSIQIPEPIVTVGALNDTTKHTQCEVSFLPIQSDAWLSHTPMLFLFRKRHARMRKNWDGVNIRKRAGWSHPNHKVQRAFQVYNDDGLIYTKTVGMPRTFTSEWSVPSDFKAYRKLANFDFNPLEFFNSQGNSTGDPLLASQFPVSLDPAGSGNTVYDMVYPTGRRKKPHSRTAYFNFRFAIVDPNNPNRLLFGAPSNTIKGYAMHKNGNCIGIGLSVMDFPMKRMREKFINGW